MIEKVNRVVRTSQRMLLELGREPTIKELAQKLAMPVTAVARLLEIAHAPIG